MARHLRVTYEGALYHLCSRGVGRRAVFEGDADCQAFVDLLGATAARYDVARHAWVLMGVTTFPPAGAFPPHPRRATLPLLTMNLTLTLPDEPALTRLGPERLRLELACALYARREVGAVAGAEIAGVDFFTFQAALRERDLPGHYGREELEQDVTALRRLFPDSPLPPGTAPREKSATP